MDGSEMMKYQFVLKGRPRLAKPYHFVGSGLPNVYLFSGVTIEQNPDHGRLVTIANLANLLDAIAEKLVLKEGELTGEEIRYLRKQMKLSQAALGKRLRVGEQTIANYEKGKTSAGAADLSIRILYLLRRTPSKMLPEILEMVAAMVRDETKATRDGAKHKTTTGQWSAAELVAG
jgi:transcriptional regulator with XRE-family HTH domain